MAKRIIRATRGGALLGALCLLFSTLASAPVQGAEVVDIRIGVHPDYTRMVFELDRPASYKVLLGNSRTEVLIALQAGSIPRRIESQKSLVSRIDLMPTASGSEARVSLVRDGLSLKEMVLVDPPRVVVDILGTKPSVVSPAAPKKPTAGSKAPGASKSKRQAKSKAKATPKIAAKGSSKPSVKPSAKSKPAKVIAANSRPSRPVIRVEAPPKQSPPAPRRKSVTLSPVAQGAKAGGAPAKVSASGIKPVAAGQTGQAPETEANETTAWAKQIFAVVGLVVLVGGWGWVRRRRGQGPVPSEAQDGGVEVAPETSNPFAVLEPPGPEETEVITAGVEAEPDLAAAVDEAMGGEASEAEADSEQALFDELPLGAALAAESDEIPDPGLDPGPEIVEPAPLASAPAEADEIAEATATPMDLHEAAVEAAAGSDISDPYEAGRVAGREAAEETLSLVRALEERIAGLQGQLEVALESRERIERQMAAQNEELRVQRAAIARTQRAVRNISRPEEESHGQATTPPAD